MHTADSPHKGPPKVTGAKVKAVVFFEHREPRACLQADLLIERVAACVLLADTQTASHLLLEAESRGYFR